MSPRPDFFIPAAITLKTAAVSASGSGDNTLVAAVVGKRILVFGGVLIANGDVQARFEDGAGGTALTGQMPLTQYSGFTAPFAEGGWFATTANTLLNLELSAGVLVAGFIRYAEID